MSKEFDDMLSSYCEGYISGQDIEDIRREHKVDVKRETKKAKDLYEALKYARRFVDMSEVDCEYIDNVLKDYEEGR